MLKYTSFTSESFGFPLNWIRSNGLSTSEDPQVRRRWLQPIGAHEHLPQEERTLSNVFRQKQQEPVNKNVLMNKRNSKNFVDLSLYQIGAWGLTEFDLRFLDRWCRRFQRFTVSHQSFFCLNGLIVDSRRLSLPFVFIMSVPFDLDICCQLNI